WDKAKAENFVRHRERPKRLCILDAPKLIDPYIDRPAILCLHNVASGSPGNLITSRSERGQQHRYELIRAIVNLFTLDPFVFVVPPTHENAHPEHWPQPFRIGFLRQCPDVTRFELRGSEAVHRKLS